MVETVVTTTGKQWLTDKMDNTVGAATFYGGWGTGGSSTGGTSTAGDATLKAEATEARVVTSNSQPSADTNRWVFSITAGTVKTIEEGGLFAGTSTATTMIIRGNHAGVVMATGDSIAYTVTLQHT